MRITNKQDRQASRTPADLERKYNLGSFGAQFSEIRNIAATAQSRAADAQDQVSSVQKSIEEARKLAAEAEQLATEVRADAQHLSETLSDIEKDMQESISGIEEDADELYKYVQGLEDTKIAEISKKVTDTEAEITSLTAWQTEKETTIAAIQQKADQNGATVQSLAEWRENVEAGNESVTIASIKQKVDANTASIVTLTEWKDNTVSSLAAVESKATKNEASITSLAEWQSSKEEDIKSIATIRQKADANSANITQLTQWRSDDVESIAAIEQTASDNASKVQILAQWKTDVEGDVSSIASIKSQATADRAILTQVASWQSEVENDVSSIAGIKSTADANKAQIDQIAKWESDVKSIAGIKTIAEANQSRIEQIASWEGDVKSIASIRETANANTAQIALKASLDDITTDFVIGVINGESAARIKANRLYFEGEKLNIKVDATNIDGTLQVGQLPSGVAFTSDIRTKVSELANDVGFQDRNGVVQIMDGIMTADYIISGLGGTIGRWAIADELLCAHGQWDNIKVAAGLKPNQILSRFDDGKRTQATIITNGSIEIYREGGEGYVEPEFAHFYFGGYEYALYVDFNDGNRLKARSIGRYVTGSIPEVPEIGISVDTETILLSFTLEWRDENGEVQVKNFKFNPGMNWGDFVGSRFDDGLFDSNSGLMYNGDSVTFNGEHIIDMSTEIVDGETYFTY